MLKKKTQCNVCDQPTVVKLFLFSETFLFRVKIVHVYAELNGTDGKCVSKSENIQQ